MAPRYRGGVTRFPAVGLPRPPDEWLSRRRRPRRAPTAPETGGPGACLRLQPPRRVGQPSAAGRSALGGDGGQGLREALARLRDERVVEDGREGEEAARREEHAVVEGGEVERAD